MESILCGRNDRVELILGGLGHVTSDLGVIALIKKNKSLVVIRILVGILSMMMTLKKHNEFALTGS